ncbi:LPS assembly lipoprotein LptE [Pseudidiomarina sp. E22-M8]|uniref:LPS-assembly lipoprotein LptE n=1 Tax=Pseudidiomarina sp. E22-M8 TaxID=3424768 RepID=UPI00403C4349
MRTLLLGGLILLLVGCGFQLQGNYQLPTELQQLRISAPQFSEFADDARDRFRLAGATLVEDNSATLIEILNDSLSRRTLSLSASGQVAEYELIYTVNYLLVPLQGETKALQVEVFRDYQDDPNFALAKTREREVLVAEMREQAAQQLVRQVIAQMSQ